ncbi:hypothetical protein DL762_003633 [Monosporascus cannonballus]|uniref:Uncharacterized protein n=1 Tax=Monosporascus cannonballus TaxID=155416 RepID=A0ABY0HA56_9PEZI|nr:hypothetical protein DL762_003633 [Monosporascus cannonballus]RYO98708.1 hypothetical protein DL763_001969 [Monosporascus cannonballus]
MHKPPKETELEEWAAETFKVQRDKNGAELFRDLTKTAYVTLHYPPVFRELFLQTERHYLDDEIKRLPSRADDLLDLGEKRPGRGKGVALAMLEPLSSGEPISVLANVNASPGRNFSAELRFSVRGTSAIPQACRRKEFTVTAVWRAAAWRTRRPP